MMAKGRPSGMPAMRDGGSAGPILKGPPTRSPGPILGLPRATSPVSKPKPRKAMPMKAKGMPMKKAKRMTRRATRKAY